MSRLAVIAPLYGQRAADNLPRIRAALAAQTRQPDEIWWMIEDVPRFPLRKNVWRVPTPRNPDGTYAIIPYSLKTNIALDRTSADYIAYLTDDSWPAPTKYAAMVAALDAHPEVGAFYCTQDYGGQLRVADVGMPDAHCRVDHTQVMHRRTDDRWPEEIEHIMVGDAEFWRRLHASIGAFHPMGPEVLDYVLQTPEGISAGRRS